VLKVGRFQVRKKNVGGTGPGLRTQREAVSQHGGAGELSKGDKKKIFKKVKGRDR